MKFLNASAAESRVLAGRDSEFTILSKAREYCGFAACCLRAVSAVMVFVWLAWADLMMAGQRRESTNPSGAELGPKLRLATRRSGQCLLP